MTKPIHQPMPAFCADCQREIYEAAESGEPEKILLRFCAEKKTLARATVGGNRIIHVVADGPVSLEEAKRQLLSFVGFAKSTGPGRLQ